MYDPLELNDPKSEVTPASIETGFSAVVPGLPLPPLEPPPPPLDPPPGLEA